MREHNARLAAKIEELRRHMQVRIHHLWASCLFFRSSSHSKCCPSCAEGVLTSRLAMQGSLILSANCFPSNAHAIRMIYCLPCTRMQPVADSCLLCECFQLCWCKTGTRPYHSRLSWCVIRACTPAARPSSGGHRHRTSREEGRGIVNLLAMHPSGVALPEGAASRDSGFWAYASTRMQKEICEYQWRLAGCAA